MSARSIGHVAGRRRFLRIVAGAGALAAGAAARPASALTRWRGVAMGAGASIALDHPDAARLIALARAEIDRLEGVFSLYRADSELSRLNRDGRLDGPAPEMVALLSLCADLRRATGGAFDPSVQPLWALHAQAYAAGAAPDAAAVARALRLVGFGGVLIDAGRIAFARPGMALTLNGVAQGFVADRVAALLAAEGLTDALIDTGEIRALGGRPDGGPWRVGFAEAPSGAAPYPLREAALATSAPLGSCFDAAGRAGHILDPRTGAPGGRWRSISVTAPRAATADALSTAFCLMDAGAIAATLAARRDARLVRRVALDA